MPVTMQDVAREAGVARSTVSKVMRGYGSIPAATRERILAAADQLGYRQDPMVSALMARIHPRRRRRDMSPVIAVAHSWKQGWSNRPGYRRFAEGARRRAELLGFRLEEFSLVEPGITPERLTRVWVARGVQGVLFAQAPLEGNRVALNFDRFSLAAIGPSLEEPYVHRVSPDHYKAVRLALREIECRGYRRPGLVLRRNQHLRLSGIWQSAYLGVSSGWPVRRRIPPFIFEENPGQPFERWLARHRPDALLMHVWDIESLSASIKCRIPEELGLAVLSAGEHGRQEAGVDFRPEQVGAEAVDQIVSELHLNERGLPELPRTVLVEPVWRDGSSLR